MLLQLPHDQQTALLARLREGDAKEKSASNSEYDYDFFCYLLLLFCRRSSSYYARISWCFSFFSLQQPSSPPRVVWFTSEMQTSADAAASTGAYASRAPATPLLRVPAASAATVTLPSNQSGHCCSCYHCYSCRCICYCCYCYQCYCCCCCCCKCKCCCCTRCYYWRCGCCCCCSWCPPTSSEIMGSRGTGAAAAAAAGSSAVWPLSVVTLLRQRRRLLLLLLLQWQLNGTVVIGHGNRSGRNVSGRRRRNRAVPAAVFASDLSE